MKCTVLLKTFVFWKAGLPSFSKSFSNWQSKTQRTMNFGKFTLKNVLKTTKNVINKGKMKIDVKFKFDI